MVLSPYVVTTTADGGPGSLRDAITQVNADTSHALYASPTNPRVDEIDFNITAASDTGGGFNAATGVATIKPQSALPTITNSVILDGYTQAGASANTLAQGDNAVLKIDLDGSQAGASAVGLDIVAQSVVRGLDVTNWGGYGIWLDENSHVSSSNSTIAGNFVGTDVTGQVAMPNGGGPQVQYNAFNAAIMVNSGNNEIGGTDPASRNVISGNAVDGLVIEDSQQAGNVSGNQVQGNFIGTDATGTKALGNASDDIEITYCGANTVGGNSPGARNIIAGATGTDDPGDNGGSGHGIYGNGGSGTVIEGNYIGTDVTGTQALGNAHGGVALGFASNVTVGGTGSGTGNVISDGLTIAACLNANITVEGNLIGYDASGTKQLGGGGISMYGASAILIGGTAPGAGNLIDGIRLINASNNEIEGNLIGTDITGTKFLGNGNAIWDQDGGSNNNVIAGNVIAADGTGVRLVPGSAPDSGNVIEGNYIGTDITGTKALGNGPGVVLGGLAINNTIGGTTPAARNIICANGVGNAVVYISASGNVVEGNFIGTDVSGTKPLGDGGDGVDISGSNNTIGGLASGAGNTIAFNSGYGVAVNSGSGNAILGNSIHDNTNLGIYLNSGTSANDNQAAPMLTAVSGSGSGTTISGTLTSPSTPNTTFRIELFASARPGPNNNGEGQTFLGYALVTTDANGNASFTATGLAPVPVNQRYLAATATVVTATDSAGKPTGYGDTSEFSRDLLDAIPFGGFLPPLVNGQSYNLGRTLPIQFQLTDGGGAYISDPGAVSSLQIQSVDANGNPLGAPFGPAGSGNTGLRYDSTTNAFVFNWSTKGLASGYYEILLTLADGTLHTLQLQLS